MPPPLLLLPSSPASFFLLSVLSALWGTHSDLSFPLSS